MRPATPERVFLEGAAGRIEAAVQRPAGEIRGLALVAHPHPLYGGTMDNKVVQTLARAFVAMGCVTWRMNFRGVGDSDGVFDDGNGEVEDFLRLAAHARGDQPDGPLTIGGFSFGGYVAATASATLAPERLVLVAPAVGRFPVGTVPEHTQVIHGEEDDVVALSEVLAWARPQKLPITVVPGAGHFFHGDLIRLQQLVTQHCDCTA